MPSVSSGVRLAVCLLAMMYADHQRAAWKKGRPQKPAASSQGREALVSREKAPISPDQQPGLGTLPFSNFVNWASSVFIRL